MSNEWVMVPREPTEAMFSASSFQEWDTFEQEWRAMLYAAPAAPQQADPVSYAVFDPSGEVVYAALSETRCIEYRDNEYRYGHSAAKHWAVRPVFAHPPAAEVQRLREALKPFAAIDLTTNQAVDAMDVLRARRALGAK